MSHLMIEKILYFCFSVKKIGHPANMVFLSIILILSWKTVSQEKTTTKCTFCSGFFPEYRKVVYSNSGICATVDYWLKFVRHIELILWLNQWVYELLCKRIEQNQIYDMLIDHRKAIYYCGVHYSVLVSS